MKTRAARAHQGSVSRTTVAEDTGVSISTVSRIVNGASGRASPETVARVEEAIARLGAVREGMLRRHMNVRGYQRDTVYFSILDDEWPTVRARLEARLADLPPPP